MSIMSSLPASFSLIIERQSINDNVIFTANAATDSTKKSSNNCSSYPPAVSLLDEVATTTKDLENMAGLSLHNRLNTSSNMVPDPQQPAEPWVGKSGSANSYSRGKEGGNYYGTVGESSSNSGNEGPSNTGIVRDIGGNYSCGSNSVSNTIVAGDCAGNKGSGSDSAGQWNVSLDTGTDVLPPPPWATIGAASANDTEVCRQSALYYSCRCHMFTYREPNRTICNSSFL